MTTIDVFVPRHTVPEHIRRRLSERLVTALVASEEPMDPAIIDRGRSLAWAIVHEADAWAVGGRALGPDDAPRYLVRVSVPRGHLNDDRRAEIVRRVTGVLAEFDDEPRRLHEEPVAWIQIAEPPDGALGLMGRIVSTEDITTYVLTGAYPTASV
jgi:phenylpyruvate tautomerase PptA (4-oxalocrotonate tautomerase family)